MSYIETYLGCDILYTTAVSGGTYYSPCITGYYFKKGAVKKRICLGQDGTWTWNADMTDGTCSEEPEPEEDTFIETFRGCEIFYTTRILVGGVVGAYYSDCVGQYRGNLADAKGDICEQQDGTWDGSTCTVVIPDPSLKHTALGLGVWPKVGDPPYDVTLTAALVSGGAGLPDKEILLYKNDVQIDSQFTDSDGIVNFTDTVTDSPLYRAVFPGDDVYKGAESSKIGPGVQVGAGVGALVILGLLYLVSQGGKK